MKINIDLLKCIILGDPVVLPPTSQSPVQAIHQQQQQQQQQNVNSSPIQQHHLHKASTPSSLTDSQIVEISPNKRLSTISSNSNNSNSTPQSNHSNNIVNNNSNNNVQNSSNQSSMINNNSNNNNNSSTNNNTNKNNQDTKSDGQNHLPIVFTSTFVPISNSFSPSPESMLSCSPSFSPILHGHLHNSLNNSVDFESGGGGPLHNYHRIADTILSPPTSSPLTSPQHSSSSSPLTSTPSTPVIYPVVPSPSSSSPLMPKKESLNLSSTNNTTSYNNNNINNSNSNSNINNSQNTPIIHNSNNNHHNKETTRTIKPPNHHRQVRQRTLFEKLYTETGFNNSKTWYERNTEQTDFTLGEKQFTLLLRYLTEMPTFEILDIFDSFDKDDLGYVGFEEFFLLVALYSSRECGQTTKFLYQHGRVMYEIISGRDCIRADGTIDPNFTINFHRFTKLARIIGISEYQLLATLDVFNIVIFDKIDYDQFLFYYFVVLDEWDRSNYSFHKVYFPDTDYMEPFILNNGDMSMISSDNLDSINHQMNQYQFNNNNSNHDQNSGGHNENYNNNQSNQNNQINNNNENNSNNNNNQNNKNTKGKEEISEDFSKWIDSIPKFDTSHRNYIKEQLKANFIYTFETAREVPVEEWQNILHKKINTRKTFLKLLAEKLEQIQQQYYQSITYHPATATPPPQTTTASKIKTSTFRLFSFK